ncbi:Protein of unknown function [Gryllus bimaculatus]|nr:Protein of unknown function [Gryllus bimaculatus]
MEYGGPDDVQPRWRRRDVYGGPGAAGMEAACERVIGASSHRVAFLKAGRGRGGGGRESAERPLRVRRPRRNPCAIVKRIRGRALRSQPFAEASVCADSRGQRPFRDPRILGFERVVHHRKHVAHRNVFFRQTDVLMWQVMMPECQITLFPRFTLKTREGHVSSLRDGGRERQPHHDWHVGKPVNEFRIQLPVELRSCHICSIRFLFGAAAVVAAVAAAAAAAAVAARQPAAEAHAELSESTKNLAVVLGHRTFHNQLRSGIINMFIK